VAELVSTQYENTSQVYGVSLHGAEENILSQETGMNSSLQEVV
jgi:hypothetical protein